MIERTPLLNIATHVILGLRAGDHSGADLAGLRGRHADLAGGQLRPGGVLAGRSAFRQPARGLGAIGLRAEVREHADRRDRRGRVGKITLACITAFALVFFNFRGRMLIFWMIFITLMLPLEVRIVPTYAVAANALTPFQTIMDWTGISWLIATLSGVEVALEWNLLNSYTGLILPLGRHRHRHVPVPPVLPDHPG